MTYKEAREYLQPVADSTPLAGYGAALSKAIEALEMAESVVRCKDCKHYLPMDGTVGMGLCAVAFAGAQENAFCSYGERRADNG